MATLVPLAKGVRFLWVHFQIVDLCDAASDEAIREILENLPEGLYDTYTRIFKKIAKTGSKATILKIMMWIVCARRPLSVEELQEAVAFDSHDTSWNADKIPVGDKMIKFCHGLVVRDTENSNVRLAHHTVQQYLVSSPMRLQAGESTASTYFWPELYGFRFDPTSANVMAGELCATYLCFSDFGTTVGCVHDNQKLDLSAAFKDRGPVSIPAALGLGKRLRWLPYKFFGAHGKFKMPEIDYSNYLSIRPRERRPSPDFRKKFALLEYVIEYWPWHTKWVRWSSEPALSRRFWDVVQHDSLAFEFRPWGPNQHFGSHGCKGCPVPDSDDLEPKDLPSLGLLHWAAETGHVKVFDIIEPPLQEYLKHERHHNETLLIACRHGQVAVVDVLLACGDFQLFDGRAIIVACASGNTSLLELLMQAKKPTTGSKYRPEFSAPFGLGTVGSIALYQASSNGHSNIIEILTTSVAEICDSNYIDPTSGLSSLQIAAKNGHLQVVTAICTALLQGQSISTEYSYTADPPHDKTGKKALHYAASSGYHDIVGVLIQHTSVNYQDLQGETALIEASKHGNSIVAKTLLDGGADPFIKGGSIYELLPQADSQGPNDREREMAPRPTAAHHAAANGHENVLAILPYSDYTCGYQVITALHLGAAYGHPNVVQTLLTRGAGTEIRDHRGMTALHYASYNGHDLVVKLLLNSGCRVDVKANLHLKPLHLATLAARSETIEALWLMV